MSDHSVSTHPTRRAVLAAGLSLAARQELPRRDPA
jgi:hypothetical protein